MPFNVQEEVSERAFKLMLKVPALTGDLVVAALKHVLKKLEEHQPVGKQKIEKLMRGGAAVRPADMRGSIDMKLLQRMARKHGVGYSVVQNPDKTFCIYFQSSRAEQMKACINAYAQYKFAREQNKESLTKRLERSKEPIAATRDARDIVGCSDRQRDRVPGRERSR